MLFNMHMYRVNPTQTDIPTHVQRDNIVIIQTWLLHIISPTLLHRLTPKATQTHKQNMMQLGGTQTVEHRRAVP